MRNREEPRASGRASEYEYEYEYEYVLVAHFSGMHPFSLYSYSMASTTGSRLALRAG